MTLNILKTLLIDFCVRSLRNRGLQVAADVRP